MGIKDRVSELKERYRQELSEYYEYLRSGKEALCEADLEQFLTELRELVAGGVAQPALVPVHVCKPRRAA